MTAARAVYQQLLDDFPAPAAKWVLSSHVSWSEPQKVQLSQIDFSNKENWQASGHPAKLSRFRQMIRDGEGTGGSKGKPVVLIKVPGKPKYKVVDGHHRAYAAHQLNVPLRAYIGTTDRLKGPWDVMHDMQRSGNSGEDIRLSVPADVRQELHHDYPRNGDGWITEISWDSGMTQVPVSQVARQGDPHWAAAAKNMAKVAEYRKQIRAGIPHPPVVLIRLPGKPGYRALCGHTRMLAYQSLGKPVPAWIGTAPSVSGPWDVPHLRRHVELATATAEAPPVQQTEPDQQQPTPTEDLELADALVTALGLATTGAAVTYLLTRYPQIKTANREAVEAALEHVMRWPQEPIQGTGPATVQMARTNLQRRAAYAGKVIERFNTAAQSAQVQGVSVQEALQHAQHLDQNYLGQHAQAVIKRNKAASLVDMASSVYGNYLGWYSELDKDCTPECKRANGNNFYADFPPVIGYPGTVHPNCRCSPGKPFANGHLLLTAGRPESVIELAMHVRTPAGMKFFHKPIGALIEGSTPRPATENGKDSAPVQRLESLAGTVDKAEAKYQHDAIFRGAAGGNTSVRTPDQGAQGAVKIVTLPDGTQILHKTYKPEDADMPDRDELAYYVSHAIGANSPAVARIPGRPNEIVENVVPGETAARFLTGQHYALGSPRYNQKLNELANSPDGKKIALLDQLISNSDRHTGNWIIGSDGKLVPIDNSSAQFDADKFSPRGSFSAALKSLPPEEIAALKPKLEALKPEFDRLGHSDWHQGMMQSLEDLTPGEATQKRVQARRAASYQRAQEKLQNADLAGKDK